MTSTHASLLSHYSKKKLVGDHRNEGVRMGKCQREHVTPSFRTNDKVEFRSNIKSRLIIKFYLSLVLRHYGVP